MLIKRGLTCFRTIVVNFSLVLLNKTYLFGPVSSLNQTTQHKILVQERNLFSLFDSDFGLTRATVEESHLKKEMDLL